MFKKIAQDFPTLKEQLSQFDKLYSQLKKRRRINIPPPPIGDKSKDLHHHIAHYINIVHLKLIHQINLLILGINAKNPEIAAIVRSCIETIGGLAYMVNNIKKNKSKHEFIWKLLNTATMGQNKKTMSGKTIFHKAPQTFHSADYVREANELLNNELKSIKSKNKDSILERYDFFSELTHPNYLSFEVYWEVRNGTMIYHNKMSCLRDDRLGDILYTIIPLILVYETVLRKAEKLEKEFMQLY